VTGAQITASSELAANVLQRVSSVVIGKSEALRLVLAGILAGGHVLLEDYPGLGKTLAARSFAQALGIEFTRAQFTPDLLPADLTGSFIYNQRSGEFEFREGPVFTGLLLADEINRTPPKTQAALLEAMQERQVTVEGRTFLLPQPFHVLATANPVEYEGTYPLPEAQLDRFLLKVTLDIPPRDAEIAVLARHAQGFDPRDLTAAGLRPVAGPEDLLAGQAAVRRVAVREDVLAYVVDLCRATRQSPSLQLGVSPRGATALLAVARAWAWMSGRDYVIPDDVKAMARPCLRHRVQVRPEAELEGVSADAVLESVLATVPVPR
jgi:MoxR-like ATPase